MTEKQVQSLGVYRVFVVILLLLSAVSSYANQVSDTRGEIIRLYVGGWSPLMRSYQEHVIQEMLKPSVEKFGPYTLEFMEQALTEDRIFQEVARGEVINLSVTPTLRQPDHGRPVEQMEVPLYHGILGLRKLVIRAAEYERFSKIRSFDDFRQLSVGQGMQWKDASIYRQSSVKVVESFSFRALFPMLAANRFDFISLGLVEIDAALEEEKAHEGKLAIHEDLYVFYPFPVYLNINTKTDSLRNRMEYASSRYIESGKLDKAFEKFFTEYIKRIYFADAKVFVLSNPSLPMKDNKSAIEKALTRFFSNRSQVFYPQKILDLEKVSILNKNKP